MTSAGLSPTPDRRALDRATQSMRCLPFRRAFYAEVADTPISSNELCGRDDWADLVFAPFGPERAEAHFNWMIRLGILRREVDGQGLTERVRLTPMGREPPAAAVMEQDHSLRERIQANFQRHRPRF